MQIDAIYENGVFKPLVPLQLNRKEVRLKIIIPDEVLESGQAQKNSMRERINAILGTYAHPRPAVTPEEDKVAWHDHLEKKYGS